MNRDMREAFRGHEHFEDTARFCELYDQTAFDPAYDSAPLEFFEPMVRRVFRTADQQHVQSRRRSLPERIPENLIAARTDRRRRGPRPACPARPSNTRPPLPKRADVAPILDTPDAVDVHSYAKPLEARVTHVALDLDVDFAAKRIGGTATLDVEAKPDAKEIILDDKGLEIEASPTARASRCPRRSAPADRISARRWPIALGADTQADRHQLQVGARRRRAAMADARADRGQETSVPVQPGPVDPQPQLDPDPGFAGNPPELGSEDHVAEPLTAVMSAPRAAEPITQGGESASSASRWTTRSRPI